MAFQTVNENQVINHGSPHFFALALHTFGAVLAPTATGKHTLGVVRTALKNSLTKIQVNATAALASGESVALSFKSSGPTGAVATIGTITLSATNVAAAGSSELTLTSPVAALKPGAVVWVEATYTAGGTPAAPTIGLIVQLA